MAGYYKTVPPDLFDPCFDILQSDRCCRTQRGTVNVPNDASDFNILLLT